MLGHEPWEMVSYLACFVVALFAVILVSTAGRDDARI